MENFWNNSSPVEDALFASIILFLIVGVLLLLFTWNYLWIKFLGDMINKIGYNRFINSPNNIIYTRLPYIIVAIIFTLLNRFLLLSLIPKESIWFFLFNLPFFYTYFIDLIIALLVVVVVRIPLKRLLKLLGVMLPGLMFFVFLLTILLFIVD